MGKRKLRIHSTVGTFGDRAFDLSVKIARMRIYISTKKRNSGVEEILKRR